MFRGGSTGMMCTYFEPWILASASPRRRDLLGQLHIPFEVMPVDVDESELSGESARDYVMRVSCLKFKTAALRLDKQGKASRVLLTADTTIDLDGKALAKPRDAVDAAEMLSRMSGRSHFVRTSYLLAKVQDWESLSPHLETTEVKMRELSKQWIDAYIANGEGLDKAGAYAIQGLGAGLIEGIVGSYSNVVGLPIEALLSDALSRKFLDLRNG